uniref:DUF5858 domain-containing protein n=1 Tax=Marseillevirus sp. TaxID=2809551 RepID=A0AA96ERY1_9VIRU|nr:hypothetical protein MarFTMF_065 [Marseillevirus sp.]
MDEEIANFVSLVQKELGVNWCIGTRRKKDGSCLLQSSETRGSSCIKVSGKDGIFKYELCALGESVYEVFPKEVAVNSFCYSVKLNPSYHLMLLNKEVVSMRKELSELKKIFADGFELSPNNPQNMEKLSEDFGTLSSKQ